MLTHSRVKPSRLIQQMKPFVYLSHLVPSVGHGKAVYLGFLTSTSCIFCYTQSSAMKWWKYRWYLSSEHFCILCFILILLLWASRTSFIMAADQFLFLCKILGILKDFLVLTQFHRFFSLSYEWIYRTILGINRWNVAEINLSVAYFLTQGKRCKVYSK